MIKKKFFLLSGLLLLFAFAGCSDRGAAEKRLANELKFFADRYVKHEFAKQIKINDQSKAWLMSSNRLLLLVFDGMDVVQRQVNDDALHEFALARYYAGQELGIECRQASWSNLTAVKHDRFSYRALATFEFTDTRRMWQRIPGCTVAVMDFKSKHSPEQIKDDLVNNAARFLPDERFDFNLVYNRKAETAKRDFTVSFFVCYDPALPGWLPEDPELAGEIKVDAGAPDWLNHTLDKFTASANGMERYKNDFYWNNTRMIRKNHDAGLVFCNGQWMPRAQAEETLKLEALVNGFDPAKSDITLLTGFLQKVRTFSPEMDFSAARQKAVQCAERNINLLRQQNDWQQLESFYTLMRDNALYSDIEDQTKNSIIQAITTVKQRLNRQLDIAIAGIKYAWQALKKFDSKNEFTAAQINIECVRQENVLKKLCPQNEKAIEHDIFQLRFLLLLKKRDIQAVNKLYRFTEKKNLLRQLEKNVLEDCKNCRRGRQKCIYCAQNPGICSDCNGVQNLDDEKCAACSGRRFCTHCNGNRTMKCLNCQGRGFIILHSKTAEFTRQVYLQLEKLLQDNIADLELKRLPL